MNICILGLGYVGLPLAVSLSRHYKVTGFDKNTQRVDELKSGKDSTEEVSAAALSKASITYSADLASLKNQDIYIVTVPTPVDSYNKPDLSLLVTASRMIGPHLKKGAIVVFESTVYPGVTEDICGPELEKSSGLTAGRDFFLGYSPERINPGDKEHTVEKITKVVAGQTPETTEILREVYSKVTKIFVAKDIKTAEAAKVIENTQRDINIAFMNEITIIFERLGISIHDVLDAARTKWNFLPFKPGLVGGHCIGVDPFYLAECAKNAQVDPEIILAGRRINDRMGTWISQRIQEEIKALPLQSPCNILVLGLTFKENVSDLRNTKVVDVIKGLVSFGHNITVTDPLALSKDAEKYYQISLRDFKDLGQFDCIIGAVSHEEFKNFSQKDFERLGKKGALIVDIKDMWDRDQIPSHQHCLSL
jgi:UDP-N-acetyl-D-galactosamine dehydrogenase